MSKKIKVTIVFGEEAANFQNERNYKTARGLENGMKANDIFGRIITREFDTLSEKDAYLNGIKDMDGWYDWCVFE